jgi:hypothetical protein
VIWTEQKAGAMFHLPPILETAITPIRWAAPLFIDEPDVSLTDFGLALETAVLAVLLAREATSWPRLRRWGVAFFGAAAVASLAGGLDHGFLRRDGRELAHDVAWVATLLAIGATSLTLIGVGAELGLSRAAARRLVTASAAALAVYAAIVLFAWREFLIAILAYAPAALFVLAIMIRRYARLRDRASLLSIAALVLAYLAAGVQQLEIGVSEDWLSHNALYHLIQAISFALFLASLRDIIGKAPRDRLAWHGSAA